ncbi:MAG: hypothetical protein AB8F95_05795 [Bacteroidia bacterium]
MKKNNAQADPDYYEADAYNDSKLESKIRPIDNVLGRAFSNIRLLSGALIITIIALVLILFVFLIPVQSVDLFNGLASDFDASLVWFWASIILLSLVIWYSTVISLYLHDLNGLELRWFRSRKKANKGHEGNDNDLIVNTLPYFFGFLVFVIVAMGFGKKEVVDNNIGWVFIVTGVLVYGTLYVVRRYVSKKRNLGYMIEMDRCDYKDFSKIDKWITRLSGVLILVSLVSFLLMSCFDKKPVEFPLYFTTTTILCVYLAGFVMLFSVLWGVFKLKQTRFSLGLSLLFIIPFFSIFNNNHEIRLADQQITTKPQVETDFQQWLGDRMQDSAYSEEHKMPIFLISAEGGGIRSMKWTALVLDQLFEAHPNMLRHTYALSGVSGGSVGMVFQQASLEQPKASVTKPLNNAISKDFLSPVTFGLLFPDMVQAIIPFPIHTWDRSRWLEDSWHYSFDEEFGSNALNMSLNDYWNAPNRELPNIFLNATCTETGQKVLMSNLDLSNTYFDNIIDLDAEIAKTNQNKGIPLKVAASLSARFPLVTSAGLVKLGSSSMNVVDGGYHDNTGMETLVQLANMIMNTTDREMLKKIHLSFILIKNSETIEFDNIESKNFLIDGNAPLLTLLSNWNNRSASSLGLLKGHVASLNTFGMATSFSKFELDRSVFVNEEGHRVYSENDGKKVILPLGWYLSKSSNQEISRQVKAITDSTEFDMDQDAVARNNFRNFMNMMQQCTGRKKPQVKLKDKEETKLIFGKGVAPALE